MMVRVEITGVGAYVAHSGSDRKRPLRRGDAVDVERDLADLLVDRGIARFVDEIRAEEAEVELSGLTVAELKALADERRVDIEGVSRKADIIELLELEDDEGDEDDEEEEDDE